MKPEEEPALEGSGFCGVVLLQPCLDDQVGTLMYVPDDEAWSFAKTW